MENLSFSSPIVLIGAGEVDTQLLTELQSFRKAPLYFFSLFCLIYLFLTRQKISAFTTSLLPFILLKEANLTSALDINIC